MNGQKILLVQPRHIYAPPATKERYGHIYMPSSLLTIGAILRQIGIETSFVDENLADCEYTDNIVGINLLGAPYISSAIAIEKRLIRTHGTRYCLLLGGQVVSGLTEKDFANLFTERTFNGNLNRTIKRVFSISGMEIPRKEDVSLIEMYNQIGDETLKIYLRTEFSFYLSQGCKFSCSFCAANRTLTFPKKKVVKEEYRNLGVALSDFQFLMEKAEKFGINRLDIYLSNLDLFQSPLQLAKFSEGINELRKRYIQLSIRLRGLSTSRSFLKTHFSYPHVINQMVSAGLHQIGFGIDGATPLVYKQTRKPQTVEESLQSIRICREVYKITPEILMVFGHNNLEDDKALFLALSFCEDMQRKYGAVPRPHVAKDIIPGNDGWNDPRNRGVLQALYESPVLFQNLDFTCIPSPTTHPNQEFRELVTKYYKKVCSLPGSLTQYVLPESPSMPSEELTRVRCHNLRRYDI